MRYNHLMRYIITLFVVVGCAAVLGTFVPSLQNVAFSLLGASFSYVCLLSVGAGVFTLKAIK
jgi:hypothetical protein